MGKKEGEEREKEENRGKEGKNLLGSPEFKKLENGRYRCVETGHEMPAESRDSYAQSKHCRLGLVDAALARSKPPLNMFQQDPCSRSKLICKLTGDTVNKTEEHIWKHINGKRFLNMLEKKEAEAEKETLVETMEGQIVSSLDKVLKKKENSSKKIKKQKVLKKKEDNSKKNKKKKKIEENGGKLTLEEKSTSGKGDLSEEDDFWIPPVGEPWDFDNGRDHWGFGSGPGPGPDADGADEAECEHEATKLSKRTKRMSREMRTADLASSSNKKKKTMKSA